jgi:hypothetical protein
VPFDKRIEELKQELDEQRDLVRRIRSVYPMSSI